MHAENNTDTPKISRLPSNFFTDVLESHEVLGDPLQGPIYRVFYTAIPEIHMAAKRRAAERFPWMPPLAPWGTICHNCNLNILLGDMFLFNDMTGNGTINLCQICFEDNFVILAKYHVLPTVEFVRRIGGGRTKKAIKD